MQLSSGGVCSPRPHVFGRAEGAGALPKPAGWTASVCKSREAHVAGQWHHAAPPPPTSGERGAGGSGRGQIAGSSPPASRWVQSAPRLRYKKRPSPKTGAVQALSPPEDSFCKLLCSLQETLGRLLGIKKERKPSPYIINPKEAGGAAEIQETSGNSVHSVRRGPGSTISRQACAVSKIRTLVTHSFNKRPLCVSLCELCLALRGSIIPEELGVAL